MRNKVMENQKEKSAERNTALTKCTTYDFDKNSFVVTPVFKEKSTETLGTVLIRLMKSEK